MSRFDWRDRGEDRRAWRPDPGEREDYGQADYSRDWVYDRDRPYRRYSDEDLEGRREGEHHPEDRYADERERMAREREARARGRREPRSWMDRAGGFLIGRSEADERRVRRRGPSDRVLWAVIVERLEDARGLDLRDVEVLVDNAEVTLNGTVRRKEEKRRIEDIADLDEVRHVQNNLRVRDRGHWTFL
jgi:BON domain-containing protein